MFCGEPPDVLKDRWAVEVSMVALINPIVTLAVESAYANISSKPNSFCIENDVIQIAQKLPRLPSKDNAPRIRRKTGLAASIPALLRL